jgi:hypothetical protein
VREGAPIAQPGGRLGQCERCTLCRTEIQRIVPGGYSKEALVGFAGFLQLTGMHVRAEATAVNLACPKVYQVMRLGRYAALEGSLA